MATDWSARSWLPDGEGTLGAAVADCAPTSRARFGARAGVYCFCSGWAGRSDNKQKKDEELVYKSGIQTMQRFVEDDDLLSLPNALSRPAVITKILEGKTGFEEMNEK